MADIGTMVVVISTQGKGGIFMSDYAVTQFWMFGVMGVMIVFGIFAFVGTLKNKSKG